MKKIHSLWMLLLLCMAAACTEDSIEGLSGKYDMDRYYFKSLLQQPTEKRGKGIKALIMKMVDENRDTLQVDFGSREWVLPTGSYAVVDTVLAAQVCAAKWITEAAPKTVKENGVEKTVIASDTTRVVSGDLDVLLTGDTYFFNGLLTDENGRTFKLDYKGGLSFEIGEDDPEASGYTIDITENPVTDADNNVYDGLTKYAIAVTDPDGNPVFELDAVNRAGATMDDLVGTYTVQGYPCDEWLADNGWVVYLPEWGVEMAGGTYFTDASGVKRYVTGGQITIARAEDSEGQALYSFSGAGLPTLTAHNEPGEDGAFSILFATHTVADQTGTVLRDQTLHSDVMGRDMLYTVYLPASWDANDAKTYPVLYLLHGANSAPMYGDGSPANNGWVDGAQIDKQVDLAVSAGTAPEMIVVMPNCTVDGQDLFYVDGYQGGGNYMTYFFTEFLPAVEAMYKATGDRAHRAVGGFSMGGYGSLYYGGLHPEMFSYVYACSPAIIIDGVPNVFDLYGAALGSESGLPGITVEIGTSDFLFEQSTWFDGFMQSIGVSYEYITRDGAHDWTFWKACAPKIVKKVGEVFAAE